MGDSGLRIQCISGRAAASTFLGLSSVAAVLAWRWPGCCCLPPPGASVAAAAVAVAGCWPGWRLLPIMMMLHGTPGNNAEQHRHAVIIIITSIAPHMAQDLGNSSSRRMSPVSAAFYGGQIFGARYTGFDEVG